jgi:hypothetical protein
VRPLAILLLAVAVGGCAAELDVSGSKWAKTGTSFNQVTLDETDCARGASDAGKTPDLIVGGLADAVRNGIRERGRQGTYEKCMRDRGYTGA